MRKSLKHKRIFAMCPGVCDPKTPPLEPVRPLDPICSRARDPRKKDTGVSCLTFHSREVASRGANSVRNKEQMKLAFTVGEPKKRGRGELLLTSTYSGSSPLAPQLFAWHPSSSCLASALASPSLLFFVADTGLSFHV